VLFLACVNYKDNRDTASAADCMPALLIVDHAITVRYQFGSSKIRAAGRASRKRKRPTSNGSIESDAAVGHRTHPKCISPRHFQ